MTLILNGSVGVSDVDGSAATPAIRGTDTNTGMFFPAADTIAFAEGGAEVMRLDSSGNLGIGTTTPQKKLVVSNAGAVGMEWSPTDYTNNMRQLAYNRTTSAYVALRTEASQHELYIGGTEAARIDASGRFTVTSQPGFMSSINANTDLTVSANTLVPFNYVSGANQFNTGSNFNTGTSLFTAPVSGRYIFSFTLYTTNSSGNTQSMQAGIRVNGAFISGGPDVYAVANAIPNSTGGTISITTTVVLNLAASDTVGVAARTNALRLYQGHCFFMGYLLG